MKTFWASQLRKASCIWQWSEPYGYSRAFQYLVFLHLDCCPRLVHVLPLSMLRGRKFTPGSLSQLETLEITWCGDLREVFPLETNAKRYVKQQPQPVTLDFPGLKRIHLHELPRLHSICGVRMSAPNLETIKIRGCWSLKRLPDVGGGDKAVECDCEKEWWDRLEWDDGSQATRYKPTHSRYYKKTLLRSSVLR
ncbi:disease resistance protein At4g27190-like [Setaria viridis]|uniref:disease resistance protein At4g27190-like n=1 Tax=Setaria viridis TaxID=4556 RepID=UPI00149354DE|nr:disease resistance protein At4g27190-like [Setaria viridis]